MSHRLLIVTGRDRPGIVCAVSGLLASRRINLEDLRMSILDGEFAMMVVVQIPEKNLQAVLDQALKRIEKKWRLTVFQCRLGALEKKKKRKNQLRTLSDKTFVIRVLGRDKSGIVAGVSRVLARYHFNITDLQCRILGAGSKALYTMVLECSAPKKTNFSNFKNALARLAKSLQIEAHLQTADIIQL